MSWITFVFLLVWIDFGIVLLVLKLHCFTISKRSLNASSLYPHLEIFHFFFLRFHKCFFNHSWMCFYCHFSGWESIHFQRPTPWAWRQCYGVDSWIAGSDAPVPRPLPTLTLVRWFVDIHIIHYWFYMSLLSINLLVFCGTAPIIQKWQAL